ncbi:MAG: HD domain-containing protein [Bacteroidia bacterium]|nr:HD domain-containing protein [Bacteroidia bacterium]MCX7763782.1 HD domain-containing protein [Bacteroidia bacterium]MDW8057910.1 HD domain-containing protein [Bacteroidia bacterium]
MLPTAKIINDPIHGFIRIPAGRVLEVLNHSIVQRLRRLSQLGLAQFVYPGAVHTRFAHALGVMHLADEALTSLHRKGIEIPPSTWESVLIAALLHDVGHGPFSHSLEGQILPHSHEALGELILNQLEKEVGDLSEVRMLLRGKHPLTFLSELLVGQLDVDRLDYLVRDSFFTGVQEGLVGTERLIYTMTSDGRRLFIEEKGLTSVEKFIVTRRFMYWQVYLHKGVLGAEWLLRRWWMALREAKALPSPFHLAPTLPPEEGIKAFLRLDDTIVWSWIHQHSESSFPPLRALSRALLWRRSYKIHFLERGETAEVRRLQWEESLPPSIKPWKEWFWIEGEAQNQAYLPTQGEGIQIVFKSGRVVPLLEASPWLRELSEPMKKSFVGAIPAAWLESLLQ